MNAKQLLNHIQTACAQHADPIRAQGQQAYMKSTMPYWGIQKPTLKKLFVPFFRVHKPTNNKQYRDTILHIFEHAQHREEWYVALLYAQTFKTYISAENIDVYLQIIRIGQWWDIVDETATNLIGKALLRTNRPSILRPGSGQAPSQHLGRRTFTPEFSEGSRYIVERENYLQSWIQDQNMWVRRTSLIAQLHHKKETDFPLLTHLVLTVAHEKDFFIRKAIGWALRHYSRTNPDAVHNFIEAHRPLLSPLSIKEGLRLINQS